MAEWTHRICERCWFDGTDQYEKAEGPLDDDAKDYYRLIHEPPGVFKDGEHAGAYRMPVQALGEDGKPEPGACCFCGGMTITGIYTRHDQEDLLCKGRHAPEQLGEWSRVGV